MRIAVISDCHLGFAYNTQLENDSFENFEEAMNKAIDLKSDLIILAGDTFDSRMPRTTVWAKALNILTKPLLHTSEIKFLDCDKELEAISKRTLQHLPMIALHGNHERRAKGELNIIEALERAGLLIHLHKNTILFEKNGIKVAIHGMSNVPERYAKDEFDQWNPKPLKDFINILVLHQSIYPFVFSPLEPPTLSLKDLPDGFDLILNGHIHSHAFEKAKNTPFYVVGSTIVTQLSEKEAFSEKGFLIIDLEDKIKVSFIPLQNCRKFIYDEIKLNSDISTRAQIEERIKELIYKTTHNKAPIVKIKIFGKENEISENDLRAIEKKFADKAIIFFSKDLESQEVAEKTELLRSLLEERKNIEEIGLSILQKNLAELNFDFNMNFDFLFYLLLENETEKIFNILLGEQKTLDSWVKND